MERLEEGSGSRRLATVNIAATGVLSAAEAGWQSGGASDTDRGATLSSR